MSKKLIVNNGQRELVLVGNLVVGRDPMCDISDADALLSRRHAEFMVNRERVSVRDLGSRNGVFVNGKRIAEGALQSGDVVQIGHLRLQYVEDHLPFAAVVDDEVDPDSTHAYWPPSPHPDASVVPRSDASALPRSEASGRPRPDSVLQRPDASVLQRSDASVLPRSDRSILESTVTLPVMRRPVPAADAAPPFESPGRLSDVTVTLAYAAPAAEAPALHPTPAAGIARQAGASHAAKGSWNTFVFTRVAVLAAIVLMASWVPMFVQSGTSAGDTGGVWLALPILVALVAAYGVASLIRGRTMQALTTLQEDVELAASGNLDAVTDPLGAKPTQDLANTVNRMIAQLRSEAARPRNL